MKSSLISNKIVTNDQKYSQIVMKILQQYFIYEYARHSILVPKNFK